MTRTSLIPPTPPTPFTSLDYARSVQIARLIEAQKYRCWYNARDALLHLPGMFFLASYVEGWLVVPKGHEVQVVEHGWIACADGRIVDPSLVLLEPPEQVVHYVPGLCLSWLHVQHLPPQVPLPVARLFPEQEKDVGLPAYQAAYVHAKQVAQQLAQPLQLPITLFPRQTTLLIVGDEETLLVTFEG